MTAAESRGVQVEARTLSGVDDLRVLTVKQPWAWAIIYGGKSIENRVRNIAGGYRGRLAIHAGLGWSDAGARDRSVIEAYFDARRASGWAVADRETAIRRLMRDGLHDFLVPEQRGAVIGTVNLWAAHEPRYFRGNLNPFACCPNDESQYWAMEGHWHLCLSNPRPIDPIPAKGRLGLWRPDSELHDAIKAALTATTPTSPAPAGHDRKAEA